MRNRTLFFLLLLCSAALTGSAVAQTELPIATIQGKANLSEYAGREVRATGVVTAITRTGFFIQTPDDKTDNDPMTSEGVFVFTREDPPAAAAIGNLVAVTGMVEEFRPRQETYTLSLTEITVRGGDNVRVVSKDNPLPKPVTLTADDFKPNSIDQLEKYEGMRVQVAAMTTVAPTGGRVDIATSRSSSNGTFFGVIKGRPRPFREPGLDVFEFVFLGEKDREKLRASFPKIALWDGNPERIRVESTAQKGARPIEVSSTMEISGLTGVLHYSFRSYTIFVDADSKHTIGGKLTPVELPAAKDDQFAVASINLENFFDDVDDPGIKEDLVSKEAFDARLAKISAAIRKALKNPDIIGVAEAENAAALKRLADRLNADSLADTKTDPKYEAFVIEGNDGRGIDNGFLVKTSRVKVAEVLQLGKDEKYKHPGTGESIVLNDRPPLLLRAVVSGGGRSVPVTLISNHLKSFGGYYDPRQRDNVRLKKKLQSEFLAGVIQQRQKADPQERIIVTGDLNMFQFNDGITDLVGTIAGKPAAADAVMHSSPDVVDPDLINLVDLIDQRQRYSYVFDGNAQVLDHILITQNLRPSLVGFGYSRINADHPDSIRNDTTRYERFSDHDPAVAYFRIN